MDNDRAILLPVPTLSICIPTYGGANRVGKLLDSIWRHWPRSFAPVEVVVLDDATPEDGYQAKVLVAADEATQAHPPLGCPLRVAQTSVNLGCVGAYNYLASRARGEWVLFLDDDVVLPFGFGEVLAQLTAALPNVGVLSWKSGPSDRAGQALHPVVGLLEPATELAGYCYAFRRELWEQLKGFDQGRFRHYGGDADFALRAAQAGHPCYRVWWPLVRHDEHQAFEQRSELDRPCWVQKDLRAWLDKWEKGGATMEAEALRKLKNGR